MHRKRSSRRNSRPKKSWIQKCKDCLRQLLAFLFSNVGIICLVVGYTSAGAVMFMKIEGEGGEQNDFMSRLNRSYDETLENIWSISTSAWTERIRQQKINEIEANLKKFQNLIVEGVKGADYQPRVKNKWSIYAAFLYCLTVITTIGKYYSHLKLD